jgi:hypothetical protein
MLPLAAPQGPARADWLHAAGIAAALMLLYAATAPRTVALEDDGLFILSSYFLGIEHPPGYPLFTLLGHFFTYLPFGSVAYRVHLASALLGALSAGLLFLCARSLVPGRTPAYLAALGLGLSPVFWSQAIIAEVYTLNVVFFLGLVYLALHASARTLPAIALVFGLSLSNHWPLMLLTAPAFVFLLWPLRRDLVQRIGSLSWLVILGLAPYAWLVYRSWFALPISFYGPMETLKEVWFFVSRSGYAEIDQSTTADWLDRIRFFGFQGEQLLLQFAVVGTLLAGAGFVVQWRVWGRRIAAFMTIAFLMPTAVLLILLGFDYDSMHKHVFHVYPLTAYAVTALWMALGAAWLVDRYALRAAHAAMACALVLAAIVTVGARENLFEDHAWGARYARAVLSTLPRDAIVFGQGDPDLVPMAYFHMIENWRPDITLYHTKGLVLGNRLFHPERTDPDTARRIVREMVEKETKPVTSTLGALSEGAQREHWLYSELDKSSPDPKRVTVELPEEARRFFEESVAQTHNKNAWVAFIQGELRRRYGVLLARALRKEAPPDQRTRRHLELLSNDFHGALGLVEGLMLNDEGYPAGVVAAELEKGARLMPSDVPKEHLSRFFYLRGALRANAGDRTGAMRDMETAISVWRMPSNPAIKPLEDLYREAGDVTALKALEERLKTFRAPRA